ncbi:MAG TPA: TonB-dependent receptor [Tenuifilaceae bacterium]|nr:TonB-dependent receptor [Tenuifilaceae bacterium]
MRKLLMFSFSFLLILNGYAQTTDSIRKVDIEEVTVTTSRANTKLKDIPQKVEVISSAKIKSIPSDNVAEVLKRTTNIDIIQYPGLSAKVGMRGFSPSAHSRSYTLILINGVPSGSYNLASINADNIDRIEIVKGPYSALYGSDAMGGVINVITKSAPMETEGRVSISSGSFGAMILSGDVGASLSAKTSFRLGYSHTEQRNNYRIGGKNLLDMNGIEKAMLDSASYGDAMKNSTYQSNEVNAALMHRFNNAWSVGANATYSFAYDVSTPGNYWGTYGQSKKDVDRLNITVPVKRVTEKNTLVFSPYFSQEKTQDYDNNTDTGFVSLRAWNKEYGFKLSDNFEVGPLKMLAGLDLDVNDYDSERFKKTVASISGTNPYQPDNQIAKYAVFAQATYTTGGLLVNAGARFDNIHFLVEENDLLKSEKSKSNYNAFNPSAGIQYTFPFGLKAHSSIGKAFSVPDAFKVAGFYSVSEYFAAWDYWWVQNYKGNPDLKPESSLTVDFGLGFTSKNEAFNFDMTFFNTNHTDKIVEYKENDTTFFKNANSALYQSFETMASVDFGKFLSDRYKLELYANLTIMTNCTFEDTKVEGGNTVKFDRDMLYIRKSNGSFGVMFDNYKGFSTRLNARYIGSRLEKDNFASLRPKITAVDYYQKGGYTAADKVLQHPDYIIFDYSVSYTFQKNKKFGLTIANLLDENYTEKDGYNMPGRSVMGSFTYNF